MYSQRPNNDNFRVVLESHGYGAANEGRVDITTAQITSTGSISFKINVVNPWSPPDCIGEPTTSQSSVKYVASRVEPASLHARGNFLVVSSSFNQEDGSPIRTVVTDGITS